MADSDPSPFETTKWDDALLPPVSEVAPLTDTAADVANMFDSPFASSLIKPGLLEQLSVSILEGSKADGASSSDHAAESHTQQASMSCATAARSESDAVGAGTSVAASGGSSSSQSSAPRLQGVASILESPFASSCLSQEAQQLQQLQLNGGDKARA